MATPAHQLGAQGEQAAADYLRDQGYTLLYRSYRYRRAEVDLVVHWRNELLVLVEVKTRSASRYGYPEAFVTPRKQALFRLAAEQLQFDLPWTQDIRFDVLALTPTATGFHIEHFEDAFY